jgi:RNA polymerase sigma-70 factor (ECF subfamily)
MQEKILVEKAKNDSDAFGKLYDQYFPKIFRYVSWRVGSRADTEDLVSDIFFKIINNIKSFKWQKGATFSSWIFQIAHNAVVDYARTRHKRDYINIDDLPEIQSDIILPDEVLDRQKLFKELYQMIQELPERQAEVITMRFFTGMKNKEVAQVLDISEKTVASSLCRGLKTLHNKFNLKSSPTKVMGDKQ